MTAAAPHIVLVSHLSEISGAGVALLETACGLRDLGRYRISLILPGHGPLADRARDRGIEPIIIPNPENSLVDASFFHKLKVGYARGRYVLRLKRFLKKEKADLVYINSSISIFPGIAANWQGTPIVWHVHETLHPENDQWRISLISQWANGLLFASQSGAAPFSIAGSTPVLIARNAIPVSAISRESDKLRAERPPGDPAETVILMNGVYELKGADILLLAVSQWQQSHPQRKARVIVAGGVDQASPFVHHLQEILHTHGLTDGVTFAGMQPGLVPLLARAHVFVSASRTEALPNAIVEAMAAGVPVIATDVGDCARLLDHGAAGLVIPPGSPEALAAALEDLVARPTETQTRTQNARTKILAEYGSEDFWRPLTEFLDALIQNP